jgi:hypothetical protein
MATEATGKVRYQVVGPVFVNGSLYDAKERDQVFILADPGLDGPNLKFAPEPAAASQEGAAGEGEKGEKTDKTAKGDKAGKNGGTATG